MPETYDLIATLNADFAHYREALDARVVALASGQSVLELDAKLEKINAAMDKSSEVVEANRFNHQAKLDEIETSIAKSILDTQGVASSELPARQLAAWRQNVPVDRVQGGIMSTEDYAQYTADVFGYARQGTLTNLMAEGGDPNGGYLVSPEITAETIMIVHERSRVRERADVRVTGQTNRVEGRTRITRPGTTWASEREDVGETTTPTFGEWAIGIHNQKAKPQATQDEIDDAFVDLGRLIAEDVGAQFGDDEGTGFTVGTGVKQPRGFATYPLQAASVAVSKDNWGTFRSRKSGHATQFPTATTTEQALIDVLHDLKEPHLRGARWYMNRSILSDIRKILVTNVGYIFMGSFREDSPYGDIMGYPVTTLPDMNAKRTSGSGAYPIVAFGDMRRTYRIYDRQGLRIMLDPYTAEPEVKFVCSRRLGGDVVDFDSMIFLSQEA